MTRSLFVLLLCIQNLLSQPLPGRQEILAERGRPYLQNFAPKEYGGYQENYAVARDQRGLVYFGNNWGVLQYDGVSWRLIKTGKETTVLALEPDSTGAMFVGQENGFGYLAPDSLGDLQFVALDERLDDGDSPVGDIWKVHATRQGIFFYSLKRIYHWADDSLSVLPITGATLSAAINDTIYYGEWQVGINRLAGGETSLLPGSELFASQQNYLIIPYEAEQTIMVATREQGLLVYRRGTFEPFPTQADDFLKRNQIYSSANLPGNRLLLGTIRGGGVVLDQQGKVLDLIDAGAGLRDQTIVQPLYQPGGSLWLALYNGIAHVELDSPHSRFGPESGLTTGVNDIIRHDEVLYAATHLGVSYLTTRENGLLLTRSNFEAVAGISTFAWGFYQQGKELFVGTDKGMFLLDGASANKIESYAYRVYGFCSSGQNPQRIFAATQNGLGVIERAGGTWRYRGRALDLNVETISISATGNDVLWLGTNASGVFRISGELQPSTQKPGMWLARVEQFGRESGLPSGEVRTVVVDDKLLFTTESGVWRFDESERMFHPDSTFAQASAGYVGQLVEASGNQTWLYSRMAEGRRLGVIERSHGRPDRWSHRPFKRILDVGEIKKIYPEPDGSVWFGGTDGVVHWSGKEQQGPDVTFQSFVRRVFVNQDSLIFAGTRPSDWSQPVLDHGHNALRFEFAGAAYEASEANRYQYWLEGFESGWSLWTEEIRKDYTNLTEGDYVFHVRVRDVHGTIGLEDVFAFAILPPWRRTWWAYGLYALALTAALAGLLRLQSKRQRLKAEAALATEQERARLQEAELRATAAELQASASEARKEVEKEQMRRRIASDLHDEIGSNLSSISVLSQTLQQKLKIEADEKARLRDIQEVAQQSADSMRDIVWFVNPQNDEFAKLIARMRETANRLLANLEFSFQAPDHEPAFETDLDFRRNFFLLYKESLQNIARHAQASKVEIAIILSDDGKQLRLEVKDNGQGFDQGDPEGGIGLQNFKKRARDLGGDLVVASEPGKGTSVSLAIPAPGRD